MTLRKTLSSASINNKSASINNKSASTSKLTLAVLGLGLCGGCAGRPPAVAPHVISGYADLSVLVRHQPGWNGLGQYDAALARLDAAAQDLPGAGQADPTLAVLPPAAGLSAVPKAGSASAKEAGEIARHLGAVQADLITGLNRRRKIAREDQISRQQDLWKRSARQLFPIPTRTAEISTDLTLQLLQANVVTLTQTLDYWDNSTPPAPRLSRLKQKVQADRDRLQALIAARIQTREAARAARLAEIQRQRQARLDYVQTQGRALAARLEADDVRVLTAQKRRLSQERQTLLNALAQPEPVSVPAAGEAGTLILPSGPGAARASLSAASLRGARAKLLAQRGRWVQALYEDTRASALDAAAAHHWDITFGSPRPGDRDMTADLEQALAKSGTG